MRKIGARVDGWLMTNEDEGERRIQPRYGTLQVGGELLFAAPMGIRPPIGKCAADTCKGTAVVYDMTTMQVYALLRHELRCGEVVPIAGNCQDAWIEFAHLVNDSRCAACAVAICEVAGQEDKIGALEHIFELA